MLVRNLISILCGRFFSCLVCSVQFLFFIILPYFMTSPTFDLRGSNNSFEKKSFKRSSPSCKTYEILQAHGYSQGNRSVDYSGNPVLCGASICFRRGSARRWNKRLSSCHTRFGESLGWALMSYGARRPGCYPNLELPYCGA